MQRCYFYLITWDDDILNYQSSIFTMEDLSIPSHVPTTKGDVPHTLCTRTTAIDHHTEQPLKYTLYEPRTNILVLKKQFALRLQLWRDTFLS